MIIQHALGLHPLQGLPDPWKWGVTLDGRGKYATCIKHPSGFQILAYVHRRNKKREENVLASYLRSRMKREMAAAVRAQELEAKRIGGGA